MSIELRKFQEVKSKVETLQKKKERTHGALEQLKSQIKREFDCDSLEEAKELRDILLTKKKEMEEEFTSSLQKFMAKWEDRI